MATVAALPLALQDAGILTPPFDLLLDGREVDVVLGAATTAVDLDLNMDSTLAVQITVRDQQRKLLRSGVLDADGNGRLDKSVDIRVGSAWYRVAKVGKAGDTFTLGCEDRSAALLRGARGQLKPRDGEDHVRFARHLCALAGVPFATPTGVAVTKAQTARQVKADRDAADMRREKGIATGASLDVKGAKAKADQIRNMEVVLGVCAALKAGPKATLACVLACIVESEFRNLSGGDADSVGILQARVSIHGAALARSIEKSVRKFLLDGFTGSGGAIKLAKDHASWTAAMIAAEVQGPRADLRGEYAKWLDEGRAIVAAYGGADRSNASERQTAAVLVQRGTPENPQESSLTALSRIGKAKGYRLFFDRNTAVYADEHDLIDSRARAILSEASPGVDWLDGEMDPAKKVNTASLQVLARLWSLPQGVSIIVHESGFLNGRWLVSKVAQSRFSVKASIELRRGTELVQPERTTETASGGAIVVGGTQAGGNAPGTDLFEICEQISSQRRGYLYGGGHGVSLASIQPRAPLDCSSSTSLALKRAGVFPPATAWVSGQFAASWGQPGRGKEFTVWANGGHVWIEFHGAHEGWNFNTDGHPGDRGPRLVRNNYGSGGFTPRHWSNR